ncbi:MAG: DNA replication and repair protein RecF [Patescibacteria group bacterium]|nr:DNA replication and repair protein RecF [Patescibacteria group bacterium]
MTLRTINIQNFRNINGSYPLSSRINVIVALNGAGKTNFLEAVGFVSRGRSFKTNNEILTVRKDIDRKSPLMFARIEAEIDDALGNIQKKELVLESTTEGSLRKTLLVDSLKTTINKFDDTFHSVIFSPNTVDLVIGSPSIRRKDLDDFLSVVDEEYYFAISEYRKVIRQRNKVLEKLLQNRGNTRELGFWNQKMVDLGSAIIFKRAIFFRSIASEILSLSAKLFNLHGAEMSIIYESKFLTEIDEKVIMSAFQKKIKENEQKEIWAGKSLYGPQREDFSFLLNNVDLKEMGSRGQQRLCAFIYKVAQKLQLKNKNGVEPIFLLDDLFSELDSPVRGKIIDFILGSTNQIILTALSEDEVNGNFLKECKFIKL